jgi:hypothetical protein
MYIAVHHCWYKKGYGKHGFFLEWVVTGIGSKTEIN